MYVGKNTLEEGRRNEMPTQDGYHMSILSYNNILQGCVKHSSIEVLTQVL